MHKHSDQQSFRFVSALALWKPHSAQKLLTTASIVAHYVRNYTVQQARKYPPPGGQHSTVGKLQPWHLQLRRRGSEDSVGALC